jgi:hypothetical protein
MSMRRKKQFLTAALCAFSMVINSVAVVAQSRDKKQEAKSGAHQSQEGQSENTFLLPAPAHQIAFPPQNVAYAAPQVEFISHEFNFDGRAVKGAPYSAEAITETIQTLGDGNRIIRNSSSKIYRDSAGRTRREFAMKAVGPWAVSGEAPVMTTINDPVSGAHYNLNSSTKIAHKMMPPQSMFFGQDAKSAAELKAKMKERLKLKAANSAEAGVNEVAPNTGVVNGVVLTRSSVAAGIQAERVGEAAPAAPRAFISSIGPGVPMAGVNGVFGWSGEGEVNTESLGTQTIEGVVANGQRVTVTIQAGKIGNERPIVTVNERWYSPELQTLVFSKNSDPRLGETTYRLTNIDRNEPDPSLFQVPADYTVEEGNSFFGAAPLDLQKRLEIERKAKRPNEN